MESKSYMQYQPRQIVQSNEKAAGAIDIFNRSIDKDNLIYHEYLGDGDTSSFEEVVHASPYEKYDITPTKHECIGHWRIF